MHINTFFVFVLVIFGIILLITRTGVNDTDLKKLINKIRIENFKLQQKKQNNDYTNSDTTQETSTREKDLELLLEKEKTFYENHIHQRTEKILKLKEQIDLLDQELRKYRTRSYQISFTDTIDKVDFEYRNIMNSCKPQYNPNRYPYYNPMCLSSDLDKQRKQTIDAFKSCQYAKRRARIFEDYNDGFSIPFSESFDIFLEFVYCQIPFAFTRYGDGEFLLANGWAIDETLQAYTRDKWTWNRGKGKISQDLIQSLGDAGNHFYGFPCPQEFVNVLLFGVQKLHPKHDFRFLSYSNFFVGGKNFEKFINFVYDVSEHKLAQSVILIINHRSRINHERFMKFAHEVIYVFDDGPNTYETYKDVVIAQVVATARAHSGCLFLISAGPLSKIFIHKMWNASKCNQYVDVGSPFDEFTKKETIITRESVKLDKRPEYKCNRYKYEKGSLWTLSDKSMKDEKPELRVKDDKIIDMKK